MKILDHWILLVVGFVTGALVTVATVATLPKPFSDQPAVFVGETPVVAESSGVISPDHRYAVAFELVVSTSEETDEQTVSNVLIVLHDLVNPEYPPQAIYVLPVDRTVIQGCGSDTCSTTIVWIDDHHVELRPMKRDSELMELGWATDPPEYGETITLFVP